MNDRPMKTIQTPSGQDAVLKTYLTARERNELRAIFLQKMKINVNENKVEDLGGESLEAAEHAYIRLAVVSYAGSSENILERLLESSPEEYDFVVSEANKVGGFKTAK